MADSSSGVVQLSGAIYSPPLNLSNAVPIANVQGKTILVTGGASGIGAAFSAYFASHGANVIIGDINATLGMNLIADLRLKSKNLNHHFLPLDVTDWSSQVAFFRGARELSPHGGIDCVIANAGINDSSESEAFEIEIPDYPNLENPPPPRLKTLRVDLDGVLYTSTLALSYLSSNPGSGKCSPDIKEAPRDRHLLLISSIAGLQALPSSCIYATAKHGVVGLFRGLRLSAPVLHGVRVNMICPQYVETPILGARAKAMLLGIPKTRIEDVVEAAARLVADQSVVGRAVLVGTRADVELVRKAGLDIDERSREGTIWDIGGEDFEQTDPLVRRVIALLNLAAAGKGWGDYVNELIRLAVGTIVGVLTAILRIFRV